MFYQQGRNDRNCNNIISDINYPNGLQNNPKAKQNGPEEEKEEDDPNQFDNYYNK